MITSDQSVPQAVDIQVSHDDQVLVFRVSGIVDEHGSVAIKNRFEEITLGDLDEVVFDFQDVTYIGSAGLGKLLLFYKKLSAENINMRINTVDGMVRDVLKELKLNTLFTVN